MINMKNKDKKQKLYVRTYKILQSDRNNDQMKRNNQRIEKWNIIKEAISREFNV